MNLLTLIHCTADDARLAFAYYCSLFFIPIGASGGLYWFTRVKRSLSALHEKTFDDVTVAEHSVLIRNLPKHIGVQEL